LSFSASGRRHANKLSSLLTVLEEEQSSSINQSELIDTSEKTEQSLSTAARTDPSLSTTAHGTDLTSEVSMVGETPSQLDSDLGPLAMSADEYHHDAEKLPIWMEIVDALDRLTRSGSGIVKMDGTFDFSHATSIDSPEEVKGAIQTIHHHASRLGVSDEELVQAVRDSEGGTHVGLRPIRSILSDSTIASDTNQREFNLTGRVEDFTEEFFDMIAGYWERDDNGERDVDKATERKRSKREQGHRSRKEKLDEEQRQRSRVDANL
jgi:hypothetical protein